MSLAIDGRVARQGASYRQGLVLGLTMAEIMILLVFCLLIALATFLRLEVSKRTAVEKQLSDEREISRTEHEMVAALKKDPVLVERLKSATSSSNAGASVDEFWHELVDARSVVTEAKKRGMSNDEIRRSLADAATLKAHGIDVIQAVRDADIVGSIRTVMPSVTEPGTAPAAVAKVVERGLHGGDTGGHKWPPIISLNEANNYYFKSGSAELTPQFRASLMDNVPDRIVKIAKDFGVDVIEVVGHTDEQPLGPHGSNLDREMVRVLRPGGNIATLVPADNAGLGLARAVSVVSVLRSNPKLERYKLIPLSGAQLVKTDDSLALEGAPESVAERRRIEIRLRKYEPHEVAQAPVAANAPAAGQPSPRPRPRPTPAPAVAAPTPAPSIGYPLNLRDR
jgi:outer membrane protein OmpA-like peptidoglycan-associated protein